MTGNAPDSISSTVDAALRPTGASGGQFSAAVAKFKAASNWLTDAHAPAVAALEGAAAELDRRLTGAMLAQFNTSFRFLSSQAPGSSGPEDAEDAEADRLLKQGRGE